MFFIYQRYKYNYTAWFFIYYSIFTYSIFCFVDNGKTIKLREAFIIGHSNLVSSGILYFLPIASLSLVGPVITKAVSLMITTAGIIGIPACYVEYENCRYSEFI